MSMTHFQKIALVILINALIAPGLCTAQASTRIMPLGDSITYGFGTVGNAPVPGGYRNRLYQLLTTAGYNVDYVGTENNNGLASLPDSDHEGHTGFQIREIDTKINGWLDAIVDPDVILLHIGTNDFGVGDDPANAILRLDDLITKISMLRPFAHIIVTNLLERAEPYNSDIQAQFNPFVQSTVNAQALLGRRVTFLDMRSAVPLADMPDLLHPNQAGYDKMAEAWLPAIQAVIGTQGDSLPPGIVRSRGNPDLLQVEITFSKPVADSAASVANFSSSDGLTFTAAELDTEKRIVTLTTSRQTLGSDYTLTVNGIVDRTAGALALPANSTTVFSSATPRGFWNNVPESAGYTLAYSLDIPNAPSYGSDAPGYAANNSALLSSFTRIAYYLELQNATSELHYVWASMDAFTTNAAQIAVPTGGSGAIFQQAVHNLQVVSNFAGVSTGSSMTGNLEFWPSNYAPGNVQGVFGANDSTFDFGDTRDAGGQYGSMQLHNATAGQTVLGFNNWGSDGGAGNADLGMGNAPGSNTDWTFQQNAGSYTIKTLQVLVQTSGDTTPPTVELATRYQTNQVLVRFSEPLDGATVEAADFTLNGGVIVLDAALDINQLDVILITSSQPAGVALTLNVDGINDSSPAANAITGATNIALTEIVAPAGVIKLKLADIAPGTENVRLIANGDFESSASGNDALPFGWNRFGNMFYNGHAGISVPASLGTNSARIHIDGGNAGNYNQTIPLTPNTDYVLGAYLWHLGDSTHTGTVELDLNDKPYEPNDGGGSISISQDDTDADQGYFVYALFNPGSDTAVNLRAFMVFAGNNGWPNQPTGALWDNISITPLNQFIPPSTAAGPQPNVPSMGGVALSFLGLSILGFGVAMASSKFRPQPLG
jgi:lysophospholipase L1-like esterase